jgi:hypothetical protein
MSRDRQLGARRHRRSWEENDLESRPRQLPAPTVSDPWSSEAQALLGSGDTLACEPIVYGSNYTFILALGQGKSGPRCLAVYKPRRGEAPLWDFPDGTLYRREYAAYLVSETLGWRFVPPTVIREGPYGVGSVQFFILPADAVSFLHLRRHHRDDLARIALFDHITNNADRKPNHLIQDEQGKIWGIDHGLTFHEDWKLRTVIFDFCEQPVSPELLRDLSALRSDRLRMADLQAKLVGLLDRREYEVFVRRMDAFLEAKVYPSLDPHYNVPRGFF